MTRRIGLAAIFMVALMSRADTVEGGRGIDLLRGGPGNDIILAADSLDDFVSCGPGEKDRAVIDTDEDYLPNDSCEYVTPSPLY